MRTRLLLLTFILNILAGVTTAQTTKGGSVCIAPFPALKGDAAGGRTISSKTTFAFRFGKYKTVTVKQGESAIVTALPSNERIMVQVLQNNNPYESFPIDFRKFSSDKICMWLYFPHITWQTYDYSEKGHGCKCFE
jgi:hypothetical protein